MKFVSKTAWQLLSKGLNNQVISILLSLFAINSALAIDLSLPQISEHNRGLSWLSVHSDFTLGANQEFVLECTNSDTKLQQKSISSPVTLDGLDWLSKYQCHLGLEMADGQQLFDSKIIQIQLLETREDTPIFVDVDPQTVWGRAVEFLYNQGLISGYPDQTFKGFQEINRAEALKILIKMQGIDATASDANPNFTDVKADDWFFPYVQTAVNQGWISGYPDGSFRPENKITSAEFLKLISVIFDLESLPARNFSDVEVSAWYYPYVGIAEQMNLFPARGTELFPNQGLNRFEFSLAVFQFLNYRPADIPVADSNS